MGCMFCGPYTTECVVSVQADGLTKMLCLKHYAAFREGLLELGAPVLECSADGCFAPAVNFVTETIAFCRQHGLRAL